MQMEDIWTFLNVLGDYFIYHKKRGHVRVNKKTPVTLQLNYVGIDSVHSSQNVCAEPPNFDVPPGWTELFLPKFVKRPRSPALPDAGASATSVVFNDLENHLGGCEVVSATNLVNRNFQVFQDVDEIVCQIICILSFHYNELKKPFSRNSCFVDIAHYKHELPR